MPITITPQTPLEVATDRLSAYLKAERAILDNQAYEINGRRLTRANLAEVQAGVAMVTAEITALTAVTSRRRRFGLISHGDRRR